MAKIYFIYNNVYFESEDTIAKSILDNATIITEEEFNAYTEALIAAEAEAAAAVEVE